MKEARKFNKIYLHPNGSLFEHIGKNTSGDPVFIEVDKNYERIFSLVNNEKVYKYFLLSFTHLKFIKELDE